MPTPRGLMGHLGGASPFLFDHLQKAQKDSKGLNQPKIAWGHLNLQRFGEKPGSAEIVAAAVRAF